MTESRPSTIRPSRPAHTSGSSHPSVLIVEDEKELADLYTAYLEDACDVRTAYNGDEALEALEALDEDLDVVLLDRRLGDWSGDELVTVIHDRQIECQVAMVTAVNPDFDIIDLAIDDYLVKPISKEELRETIEELLVWKRATIGGQELLALVSRKITLENEKGDSELGESREYAKLLRRIEVAKDRLQVHPEPSSQWNITPEECPNCHLRWDLQVGQTVGYLKIGAFVWKCTQCGNVVQRPDPRDRKVARR